jgi:signal-transduction protein with cAMP-binding, CBS, and nucleotidyltransferase domain
LSVTQSGRLLEGGVQQFFERALHVPGHQGEEALMKVADILRTEKETAEAVRPVEALQALAHRFRTEGVGALIVRGERGSLDGIITERDMAHGLAVHGEQLPRLPASALMTTAIVACSPEDSVADVARLMTQRRLYHLPVSRCGRLIGVVSIGDVMRHRMDEMGLEASVLRDIAIASR